MRIARDPPRTSGTFNGALHVCNGIFGVGAIWAVLPLTNAFGLPFDEGSGRFRSVVNNDEKCVPLARANHVQFHWGFGRGEHSFACARTHRSTRQLQALLASDEVPRFRSGVCMRWDIGFRAEICFVDDDLVAGRRRESLGVGLFP